MKKKVLLVLFVLFSGLVVAGAATAADTQKNVKVSKANSKSVVSKAAAPTLGQALDNTKLTWTTTPTGQWYYHPWNGNTTKSHDGVDAAEASSLSYGGSPVFSKLQTTVYGPGTIKFYWMKYYYVSSQDFTYVNAYGSCLFFFKDNNKSIFSMDKFSKDSAWNQKSYTMGPGKHVLTWNTVLNCPANSIYTNFAYKHWNSLSAYVDQVQWIPAPKVSSTTPTNNKTGYSRTANILIKFTENIKASTYYNSIKIKNLSTNKYVTISKAISGNTLYLRTARTKYTWYQVIIPARAVRDQAGNSLAAFYVFKFRTGA